MGLTTPHQNRHKAPHVSYDVKGGSGEHDADRIYERTIVVVPFQTMVALAVPDNRLYSRPLPE